MYIEDFLPNDNCWDNADNIKKAVDQDCSAAFIQATLGNNRFSGERLLYMAVNKKFEVLKTAINFAVTSKRVPRVEKIIEWMIASQKFTNHWRSWPVCDLDAEGETIAEAIKPALVFLSQNDWNRIVGRTYTFVDSDIDIVRKVLALFGKTTEHEEMIESTKTYVIPGKYDQITATQIGGFYVMDRDFCSCCDYEEAKAIAAELGEYGWRLPSKDEMETIDNDLPHYGTRCYTDKIFDEKYDLVCDATPEKLAGYDTVPPFRVDPHVYDFFPFREQRGRKYLGYCMWMKNGSIYSVPLGFERKWIVSGRKYKDKKISVRLIRDPDLIVKDI
jgi:hypothetical protein